MRCCTVTKVSMNKAGVDSACVLSTLLYLWSTMYGWRLLLIDLLCASTVASAKGLIIGWQAWPEATSIVVPEPLSALVAKEERCLCSANLFRLIKEHGLHCKPWAQHHVVVAWWGGGLDLGAWCPRSMSNIHRPSLIQRGHLLGERVIRVDTVHQCVPSEVI